MLSADGSVTVADIVANYEGWVSDVVWLDFEKALVSGSSWAVRKFCEPNFGRSPGDGVVTHDLTVQRVRIRSVKRGDEVYNSRLLSRIRRLSDALVGGVRPFWPLSKPFVKGSWLWLTYEFDSHRFSLEHSWNEIRREFNRHRAWLTKQFGCVKCWTFLQAHSSGYAHLHVIAQFLEHVFSGFRQRNRLVWRCDDKPLFARNWDVGFVDVRIIRSVAGVMFYGGRYGSRVSGSGAVTTLALGHHFKRKGFTMSLDWSRLSRGVGSQEPLPSVDVISRSSDNSNSGVDFSRLVVVRYRFLGFAGLVIDFGLGKT